MLFDHPIWWSSLFGKRLCELIDCRGLPFFALLSIGRLMRTVNIMGRTHGVRDIGAAVPIEIQYGKIPLVGFFSWQG